LDHQKNLFSATTDQGLFPPLPSVLGEVIVNMDGLGMGNDQLRWIFCTKNQLKNRQKVEFCSSWKRKRCDQTGSWSCPALPLASCNQTSYPLPPGSTRLLVLLPRSLPSLKSLIPLHGPAAWRVRPFWANSSWDRKVSIKKSTTWDRRLTSIHRWPNRPIMFTWTPQLVDASAASSIIVGIPLRRRRRQRVSREATGINAMNSTIMQHTDWLVAACRTSSWRTA
jgi:hypothetical protein